MRVRFCAIRTLLAPKSIARSSNAPSIPQGNDRQFSAAARITSSIGCYPDIGHAIGLIRSRRNVLPLALQVIFEPAAAVAPPHAKSPGCRLRIFRPDALHHAHADRELLWGLVR